MKKTAEQEQVIELIGLMGRGENLVLEAYAGCAKTSTAIMAIEAEIARGTPPHRILFTSFAKSIITDSATRLPPGVHAKTFHALAYRDFGAMFRNRFANLTGRTVAAQLQLQKESLMLYAGKDERGIDKLTAVDLTPAGLGYWLINVVNRWCASTQTEFTVESLLSVNPAPDLLTGVITAQDRLRLSEKYLPHAIALWRLMSDLNGNFPSSHSVYVKLWYLSEPLLSYSLIVFDENQDADPLMIDVIDRQPAKKLWIGDRHQSIYGWRGAVRATDTIEHHYSSTLSQTFRFGDNLAAHANGVLSHLGASVPMVGLESETRILQSAASILESDLRGQTVGFVSRTNANAVQEALGCLDLAKALGRRVVLNASASFKKQVEEVDLLINHNRPTGSLSALSSRNELLELIEQNESAGGLASVVKLVTGYDKNLVDQILERNAPAQKADPSMLVFTNTHQAKGLEYDHMILSDDYIHPKSARSSDEESRLFYVGMTRAKKSISIQGKESLDALIGKYR